jgi:hypothetical protein
LRLAIAAALIVPLSCGVDPGEPEKAPEGPVGQVQSPSIAHDLTHKINTGNSGSAYIVECEAAGVPVPEVVADPTDQRWINHGSLQTEFLSVQYEAEIWSYEDPNIDGVCAALPRWNNETESAVLFGVICLGRATSTTCFWDNPSGTFFPRGEGTPIAEFVGGFDLEANGQGECSDCHAGENPFIVHPTDPAFSSFRQTRNLTPTAWPQPIVPSTFPGNPGPIDQLGPVPQGEVRCDSCHGVGSGIRFPLVSNGLAAYCSNVLYPATTLAPRRQCRKGAAMVRRTGAGSCRCAPRSPSPAPLSKLRTSSPRY